MRFCNTIFKDIGKACLISVLDLIHANPYPRVISVTQTKGDLIYELIASRENDKRNGGQRSNSYTPKVKKDKKPKKKKKAI